MNKHVLALYGWMVASFILMGCQKLEDENKRINKPEAMGRFAELSLIAPRALADSAFTDSLYSWYGKAVGGLPFGGEPSFSLRITDETYLKGYFILHSNVILLMPRNLLHQFKPNLSKKAFATIEKASKQGKDALILNDLWSTPQKVLVYFADDVPAMKQMLNENKDGLLHSAIMSERETGAKRLFRSSISSDSFALDLMKTNGFALRKKAGMRLALNDGDFYWLREESGKYDLAILIYSEDYSGTEQLSAESIIRRRNRYTAKHIQGPLPGTFMKVSSANEVPLQIEESNFKGRYAVEMRGWWELENDFMGGPFVNYTIYDEQLKKVITLEGYVYAPNEPKIEHLRELEVILHTFATRSN